MITVLSSTKVLLIFFQSNVAFESLGFKNDTAERLSTDRPSHLSLLDIAQIHVEDTFQYDLLLLSGGLPGFPNTEVKNNTGYWSTHTQGGEEKKFYCKNFDKSWTPEKIIDSWKNDATIVDPKEGLD